MAGPEIDDYVEAEIGERHISHIPDMQAPGYIAFCEAVSRPVDQGGVNVQPNQSRWDQKP